MSTPFKPNRFTDNSPEVRIVAQALAKYSKPRGQDWRFYSLQAMSVLSELDAREMLVTGEGDAS